MLSPDERREIEAQEARAAAQDRAARLDRARQRTADAYRREVRARLRPGTFAASLRWALPLALLAALLSLWVLSRPEPVVTDDALGGVTLGDFRDRCQAALADTLQVSPQAITLPDLRGLAQDVLSSPDGRRWTGTVQVAGRAAQDVTCTYTAADDTTAALSLEEP
ncbi:hypothetical protein GCM10008956_18510 [Deinococcus arenae]|uniref:Uncharacterized protein n=1 Tax=Deinococcus arenae TaxID=1452751 RepID=A0A8H9LA97_9DEIO|nr:hypothetical protein [Deinococcus arenae]AWT36582.1 hypothetical protein DM785_14230 [Deinococcus actinosclerus]GGM42421.1 hypothetical protein GCM10008956_18510 [Deinococcus arenae]